MCVGNQEALSAGVCGNHGRRVMAELVAAACPPLAGVIKRVLTAQYDARDEKRYTPKLVLLILSPLLKAT